MTPARRPIQWGLLLLLLCGVTINYIDRGSLSIAAPVMSEEFSLETFQLGVLFSAFFWTYSIFQIAAGWLVDRYDVKWVFGIGFFLWSAATAATGFVSTFQTILWLRVLLGAAESVNYPACSKILARHFAEHERGFANGLVDGGSKIGPALSTLLGGLLVGHFGWRNLFLTVGFGGLLWLWPWFKMAPSNTCGPDHPAVAGPAPVALAQSAEPGAERPAAPTMLELLAKRELWGTSLAMFALGYVWYFLLSWLPSYLIKQRGFSMNSMALLGSLPFWGMACTSVSGGWLSDFWIYRGHSPTFIRKLFVIVGLTSCAVFMFPAALVKNASLCLWLIVVASVSLGIYTSNVWAITQTLAGPAAAGKWAGVQNAIGNFGGIVSPMLTGWIAFKTGSFVLAFAAASVILLLAISSYVLLVRNVAPVPWRSSA